MDSVTERVSQTFFVFNLFDCEVLCELEVSSLPNTSLRIPFTREIRLLNHLSLLIVYVTTCLYSY